MNIHPIRGVLWVCVIMLITSLRAEGLVSSRGSSTYTDRPESIEHHRTPIKEFSLQGKEVETMEAFFSAYAPNPEEAKMSEYCFDKSIPPGNCDINEDGLIQIKHQPSGTVNLALLGKDECKGILKSLDFPENTKVISGYIEDNLYSSAVKKGVPPSVILDLSDIFSSHVDFTTDIQKWDSFSVIMTQSYSETKPRAKFARVLAARITVSGQVYEAYYFQMPNHKGGYYDEDGKSVEKFFMKAPLQYRRISSFYAKKRLHPVLKIYRPHFGIDYAAPTGTPVSAIGDGKIVFAGIKGGFGKLVEIKHNAIYTSTYGHLSRFAKNIRPGVSVTRGQVIGYVGMSGLATGPHLDFRFYENNRPLDFTKFRPSHYDSIPSKFMAQFKTFQSKYQALLNRAEKQQLAKERF